MQSAPNHTNVHDAKQVKLLLEREGTQRTLAPRIQGDVVLELLSDSQERGLVYKVRSEAGTHVVRFPLDKNQEEALQREMSVTGYLRTIATVKLPDTVYYPRTPELPALAVHRWIVGEPLTTEMYNKMSRGERRALARDIALFLIDVHSTDRSDAVRLCGEPTSDILESPEWFNSKTRQRILCLPLEALGTRVYAEIPSVLREFEGLDISMEDFVLAHGDIHGFNLAMQSDAGRLRLSGVFDFGNTGLLDLNEEFFRLHFIAADLVGDVLDCYRAESAGRGMIQPERDRINLYWKGFLLYLMEQHYRAGELGRVALYRRLFEDFQQ